MLDRFFVDKVRDVAQGHFLEVISSEITLQQKGRDYTGDCPVCRGEGKFSFSPSKGIFKCWSCQDVAGKDAVKFLMQVRGLHFEEAVHELARRFAVIEPSSTPPPAPRKPKAEGSFCRRMLSESGLTEADVEATVYKSTDTSSIFKTKCFRSGTLTEKDEITDGDDVIIEYYDLDGLPVTYERHDVTRRRSSETRTYFRVRWQYPDAHLDKNGKPYKYKSPAGSGTPIYIPERIRRMYKDRTPIPRLFIQEGEKKAEKACKHGIPSVAVSGIMNLGCRGALPEDLVRIIRDCSVSEVVFLMDSDFNDLSREKRLTEDIAKRPRNFFYAARNYKDYMRSLKNRELYVEIYLGHIKKTGDDKGIDDLLAGTLKGREDEFKKDMDSLMNEKGLEGQYARLFKITSMTDHQIEKIWGLDSVASFARMHREELQLLPEFLFGRHKWKIDDKGEVVSAQPFDEDEKFWEEIIKSNRSGDERSEVCYRYVNARNFLYNRGFGRYRLSNGTYSFIQVEKPFVRNIQATDARDYLIQFAEINCPRSVLEMLFKGSVQYLGPDKLSNLPFIEPAFLEPQRDCQYFYFQDTCWIVKRDQVQVIPYSSITHNVWQERKRQIPVTYLGKLIDFEGRSFTLTPDGEKCHFLRFLINSSDFSWRKKNPTPEEREENVMHLLSKLTAIGYMAMDAKDPNVARAVIAMDGRQSEVGESNGRSGKSLVGELMRHITTIAYINGKKRDILEDQFIWNDVTEKTRLVFIDDVLQSFNFEFLFPNITGDWTVNYKGKERITFPFKTSPKLYIPTNHAIKGDGSSFEDRQWIIAFSDYYNSNHKPADDFGSLFFSEWDFDQWNLTWNLIACCIQLYLRYGVIQAPKARIEQRRLRQEISEGFLLWADEYFSAKSRIGVQIPRKELQNSYYESDPQQRKYVTPNEFKKRFKKYCIYRHYILNPNLYDPATGLPLKYDHDGHPILDDKSSGIEYFTIAPAKDNPETGKDKQEQDPTTDEDPDAPF